MEIMIESSFEVQPVVTDQLTLKLEAMRGNETLNLANQFFGDEGCAQVAEFILQNTNITAINLDSNNIGSDGVPYLLPLLSSEVKITSLSLQWNNLGLLDAGIATLADSLMSNRTVTMLDLRNNQIGPEGGVALGKMLRVNQTMQILDLRWNEIGDVGGEAILAGIQGKHTLKQILLSGNSIPEATLAKINHALQHPSSFEASPEATEEIKPHQTTFTIKEDSAEDELTTKYNARVQEHARLEARLSELSKSLKARQNRTQELENQLVTDLDNEKKMRKSAEAELAALKESSMHREIHDSHASEDLARQISQTDLDLTQATEDIIETRKTSTDRITYLTSNLSELKVKYENLKTEREGRVTLLQKTIADMKFQGAAEMVKLQKSLEVKSQDLIEQYKQAKEQCNEAQHRNLSLKFEILQTKMTTEMERKIRTDEIWQDGNLQFKNTQKQRQSAYESIHASREGTWDSIQEIRKERDVIQRRHYSETNNLQQTINKLNSEINELKLKQFDIQTANESTQGQIQSKQFELERVTSEKSEVENLLELAESHYEKKLEQATYKHNKETEICQLRTTLLKKRNTKLEELVVLAKQKVEDVKLKHENLSQKLKINISKVILDSCKEHFDYIDTELEL